MQEQKRRYVFRTWKKWDYKQKAVRCCSVGTALQTGSLLLDRETDLEKLEWCAGDDISFSFFINLGGYGRIPSPPPPNTSGFWGCCYREGFSKHLRV